MGSVNKVILVGNLGADPELKYTPSSRPLCNLRIATTDVFKDKSGQRQEKTEWHRVTVWGDQAENCNKYLAKGRSVYIEGRLQTRSYDKEGQKHYATDVVADRVVFLGSGGGGGRRWRWRRWRWWRWRGSPARRRIFAGFRTSRRRGHRRAAVRRRHPVLSRPRDNPARTLAASFGAQAAGSSPPIEVPRSSIESMLVVRRLVALSALLVPILAPAWAGAGATQSARRSWRSTAIVTRTAIESTSRRRAGRALVAGPRRVHPLSPVRLAARAAAVVRRRARPAAARR